MLTFYHYVRSQRRKADRKVLNVAFISDAPLAPLVSALPAATLLNSSKGRGLASDCLIVEQCETDADKVTRFIIEESSVCESF